MIEPARYPYVPDEAFLYFPPRTFPMHIANEIKNGKVRLIFDGGVQFDQEERTKLQEFQQWLTKKAIVLDPYW